MQGILQFSPDLQLNVYLTNYPDILTGHSQLIFLHAPQKRVIQAAVTVICFPGRETQNTEAMYPSLRIA